MPTLVIDTATAACSTALIADGRVVARAHEIVGRGHAERLVPMIGALLQDHPRPGRILVDCGPGSFTGVRVGLAAARALGLAWGVEVRGYSSMALLAAMATGDGPVVVVIPGGHGEVFVQRFAGHPDASCDDLRSLAPAEAAASIEEPIVFGEGAAAVVAERGWGEARMLLPDASAAWRLPPALATLPPNPIYGRAPDARLPA